MNCRTLIFGAGRHAGWLLAAGLPGETVIGLVDNDPAKHGAVVHGHRVCGPHQIRELQWDLIRIACPATAQIYYQLLALGVPEDRITSPLLEPENRRRLAALRNKHAGQPAVIAGNGPSLRLADLEAIGRRDDVVTFAFNKIYLAYDRVEFRPTYYMVEDWLVAENNAAEIDTVTGSTKLIPEIMLRFLRQTPDTTLFGLIYEFGPDFGRGLMSEDPLDLCWGASVVHTAIQWAFYMGCDPVYLIGVDFTFDVPRDQTEQILVGRDTERNHFIANYRGSGERWNRPMFMRTQIAYEAAQAHARRTGRRIVNITRGGALEIFPRVAFDAVFPLSCPPH